MKSAEELKRIVLKALEPIKKISCDKWAEKYFVLPSTSAEPGRYRLNRTPYAEEILKAFTQPGIQKVVVMSSSQVAKTTIILIVLARFIHVDPCNILIIQPTLELAQDFSKDRIDSMIRDVKELTPLFYGEKSVAKSKDKTQTMLSKFFRGGRLVLVGANSPAGLASRPIRLLLCDEVDRYNETAGKEGDPIALADKRQTSYWNRITGLFSTPTVEGISRIEKEYFLGTQERWSHKCPNCGEYHVLEIERIVKENGEYYWQCEDCGYKFSEQQMKSSAQKYIAENPNVKGIRSFWVNAFSSPWLSWTDIMREWEASKGDEKREQVVVNTRFGKSYKPRLEYENEEEFLRRREEYESEIPAEVKILTASVDVQANRLEYEICGWNREERWGILRGIVKGKPTDESTWAELETILFHEYQYKDGRSLKVARTFVDSGYSTNIIYAICRKHRERGWYAIKGKGTPGLPLLSSYSRIKDYGIILTTLGVNDGKQEVYARLSTEPGERNYWHYPTGKRGYDEIYFRQMMSERQVVKVTNGVEYEAFEKISRRLRNESLDLAVYNLAAIKSLCIDWENFGEEEKAVKVKRRNCASAEADVW